MKLQKKILSLTRDFIYFTKGETWVKNMCDTPERQKSNAIHECGHHLVHKHLNCELPLIKITIDPLHKPDLSLIFKNPSEFIDSIYGSGMAVYDDKNEIPLKDRSDKSIINEISALYGGIVAEEVTGYSDENSELFAGSDLRKAELLAEHLSSRYPDQNKEEFIDNILNKALRKTVTIIQENKAELELSADKLLEEKTLYPDQIEEILQNTPV